MKVEFYADGILLHALTPTTTNIIGAQNLNASATSMNNATGGTAGALDIHAATIIRVGKNQTQPYAVQQSGTVAALILKRGPGLLHTLGISGVVNNSVVALWDGITAASPSTLVYTTGSMGANTVPFSVDLHEVGFYNGLTLAITTANSSVTVVYE
jgi:hypothetical protein